VKWVREIRRVAYKQIKQELLLNTYSGIPLCIHSYFSKHENKDKNIYWFKEYKISGNGLWEQKKL
jgi:hypothetical protein